MHYWWQWSEEGYKNALRYFQNAVEIDPSYAPAHAGVALVYRSGGIWLWPPRDTMPKCKEAARKAIDLDPTLADAYVAMAAAQTYYDWDWAGAEENFKRALQLSPHSSVAMDLYNNFLVARGRFDEAIALLNNALKLDPLAPGLHSDLGWTYASAGRAETGIPHLLKALELESRFLQGHVNLGVCYLAVGKIDEAVAEFEIAVQLAPDSPYPLRNLGHAFGSAGRRAEALKILAALDQLATRRYVPPNSQAFVYVGLGQKDIALDWLEKAYDERDGSMTYLKVQLPLKSLHTEPRFQALLKKMGLDK
ncbi:MAG: hypothetical protein DME26_02330 [Verrucomicrobia bacterium]|nr:MAG: hypothetical protein DME26_02330 [Verrucomicrobiota bacterium]